MADKPEKMYGFILLYVDSAQLANVEFEKPKPQNFHNRVVRYGYFKKQHPLKQTKTKI